LFGAPLALLAAIYTSEFLPPRLRTKIKSLIEMMASLPSVVLGFLGGLVIAPFIEGFVPAVICSFVMIPLTFLCGAYLWQQMPNRIALRLAPYRLVFVTVAMVFGFVAAWVTGPIVERIFFAGDIVLWLDKQQGSGTGAWLFLLLPACSLAIATIVILFVNPWLAQISSGWTRRKFVILNLLKFVVAVAIAFSLAVMVSSLLTAAGTDPRGSYVGTYVQRNALIVGFVMGFAIIPIIYTISEDALSTVPQHLRSASLGAGATPWQTAVRIVIPTAMSGLFSALMIGLGRAVGETMIVLMAAGNTPVMEWNIFNGFRTLSANIAVELPEAVRDSTHYRTLFLAAPTLLVMTFVINTVAEMVRLRFRKRAVQL
jgi:phosphate transport system permease protein